MNTTSDADRDRLLRTEGILAGLLRHGALFAAGWLVLGMAGGLLEGAVSAAGAGATFSDRCLTIGIALLIALPVLRVALMMVIFAFERDFRFAAISAAVLIIIAAGFVAGAL